MKVAYLGPFTTHTLKPFIPSLSSEEITKYSGMGGTGLIHLINKRLEKKYPTIIITLDNKLKHNEYLIKKRDFVEYYVLPHRGGKSVLDLFRLERKLIKEVLEKTNPDLIHAHWTYEYALAALKSNLNKPIVITARDNAIDVFKFSNNKKYYFILLMITLWVYKKARYITVVSPHVMKLVKKISKAKIWLVENAVSNEFFNNEPEFNAKKKIVTISAWNKLKNPKPGMIAFYRFHKKYKNSEYHLCGKGMEKNGRAYKWAKERNIDSGMIFHGMINQEKIKQIIKNATVLLHTSKTEACSMAIAEAMAHGIPVIGGKDSGGVPWQLDYGNAGLLVDIDDPEEIEKAFFKLLFNSNLWHKMSKNAKVISKEKFSPDEIFDKYNDIYKYVIRDFYNNYNN